MPACVVNVCETVIRCLPRLVQELEKANKLKSVELKYNQNIYDRAENVVNEIMGRTENEVNDIMEKS